MSPKRKKWIFLSLIVAVIALPLLVKALRGERATEVKLTSAATQEIAPSILASGTLAYRTEVNLTSELIAKVKAIHVKEGDQVHAGQVMLTLDPETYRNAIEREQASRRQSLINIERQRVALALREKQFARSQQLLAKRMIDQSRFDEDRNQLELARVELRSSEESLNRADAVLKDAHEQLAKTSVLAPISGTVVALPIKVGETAIPSTSAMAGAQLMKIADTSAIQAELKVDEADIANIKAGQSAKVYAAAYPDTAIDGAVEKIALAPTIEAQGRAYLVTVLLSPRSDLTLRSGMSARTDILLSDGQKRLAVPVEAVITEEERAERADEDDAEVKESADANAKTFVWVAREGKAKKTEIKTGLSDDRWEEVVSGVKAGEKIIVGPAKIVRRLSENEAVKPMDEPKSESRDKKSDGIRVEASND